METTFNPNATIVINKATGFEAEYITLGTNDVISIYHDKNRYLDRLNTLQSKVNKIIDNLTEEYWFNPNTEKEEVLSELCEILGHSPMKTIQFSGRMTFSGSVDVLLSDAEDFDLESYLSDNIYVESHAGDIEIDNYDVDYVSED